MRASASVRIACAATAFMVSFSPASAADSPKPTLMPSLLASTPEQAPVVVDVSISGNAHISSDKILAVVKTKVGDRFNEATVREDLQSIFDLGYFSDQTPPLIRQRPGGVAITYRVVENPVLRRIVFRGDDHVPSDTLLALMDTSVGQVLNTSTFHEDVLKINSYYDKMGYGGQLPSHVAGLNIDPKTGELDIQIREGLTVRHINILGDHVLPVPLVQSVLALREGEPYSEAVRDKDFENIKKLYEKYDLSLGDFTGGVDSGTVDLSKGTADVDYTISVARVGAVLITGNMVTKDEVIRRQLRLRPGMIVTQSGLRRDYDRLNNLGFFEKVELNSKPGPDPKNPAETTLDWNVKEQRTGTAGVGAGYSGGVNGTGLTGYVTYGQSNLNGSGNGVSVKVERGARLADASLSATIPYLGKTKNSQKYSLGGSVFTQEQTNYYQVYNSPSSGTTQAPNPVLTTPGALVSGTGTVPVQLVPNSLPVNGVVSDYRNQQTGVTLNVGRHLSDQTTATLGINVERLSTDVTVPLPYYVNGNTTVLNGTINTPFGTQTADNSLGINATSIANQVNGQGYNLRSVVAGLKVDTRDDVFNPRRGYTASLTQEAGVPALGSDFSYGISTFDGTRFFPVLRNATLGFHLQLGATTGAVPTSKLFVYSDQQLRGYGQVFYGTQAQLGQVELRLPLDKDRKFSLAFFGDYGALRITGAQPSLDSFGDVIANYDQWYYHGDVGTGVRFDLPQLGFRSIRLDFAKGKLGTHTSFGIGQSF